MTDHLARETSASVPSSPQYGVVGLGIIGSRVLRHATEAGLAVTGWNRTPLSSVIGRVAASLPALAEQAEVIQLFVSDGSAAAEVIEAMRPALTTRHLIVCSATIGKPATIELAARVAELGAGFLDCPFTGSKGAAEARQLVYFVSGADEHVVLARPLLAAASRALVRMGPIGEAATLKVVTNMIGAAQVQILAEALATVQAEGIDGHRLVEALEFHAARSVIADMKLPKMLASDYEPHFSVKHMLKDVRMGVAMGNSARLPVAATRLVAAELAQAAAEGMADLDFSALFRVAAATHSNTNVSEHDAA
jgi:3-hydroxyisobutyrate dehydrogenase-like beta-hydroxyacid dehydrogenase